MMLKRVMYAMTVFGLFSSVNLEAKAVAKENFAFPIDKPLRIIVFRPDVQVGELTVGGVDEANPDWTATARGYLEDAVKKHVPVKNSQIVFLADPTGEDGVYVSEYRFLFRAVADAIMKHKIFPGGRLPTKKTVFDWSLGTGASKLAQIGGGDYALFLQTHDSYGSAGRKTAQIVGAMFGVAIIPGIHIGYAGLVDLSSGDVVWFNADFQMGGDVRTGEGSEKRALQLLAGFPSVTNTPEVSTSK